MEEKNKNVEDQKSEVNIETKQNIEKSDKVNDNLKEKNTKNSEKPKKIKVRTLLVLAVILIFILGASIIYRANYIEVLEIGEEYVNAFSQNIKYKMYIGIINFIIVFGIVCITNGLIRKGLKKFFEEEKKEMPKLPNKSIALVIALITSLIVSNMFLQKTILFINSAQFGIGDPMYGMDVGFYMFQAPLIGQLLYYGLTMTIILTIYIVGFYIIVFNIYFDGIDGQTLRGNTFIKQLLFNAMLAACFIAAITLFNMQNMVTGPFLNLDNTVKLSIIGSGAVDGIKLWGYRIFSVIIVLSVYIAIRAFKKNNTSKVIKSLVCIPIYLVALFIVLFGYNMFFVKGSELDKQKSYITENIRFTKTAYNVNINEEMLVNTGTITEEEANKNEKIINNIPIVTEATVINNLRQTQTSTGYYTYERAKASIYNDELVYIAARELNSNNEAAEYTHGFGAIITAANETDDTGNIKYISREFKNDNIVEPRIYYGTQDSKVKIVNNGANEFDYPTESANNMTYEYTGKGRNLFEFIR